ncbi:hypothetical protein LTR37_008555 [Vermiconidia calcicola]|uniref:Uncharacterized protein n=1 Tax=Vermiconidia calcicola TaxID=1690605 RepID=A0ACC3ND72_9PEZI|nr:hypothetical protein LTR37_008555 [Vermiconidia calcicola]
MALKSPMMPSPTNGLASAFSPYSASPNSPAPNGGFNKSDKRSSGPSDSLAPPASPYPSQVEPSPVDSNGTETTEIEEDAQDDSRAESTADGELHSPDVEITSPQSAASDRISKIDTKLPSLVRSGSTENDPQSVIHAPSGFKNFEDSRSTTTSPTAYSENTVVSPSTPEALGSPDVKKHSTVSPVNTDVPRFMYRTTPRAQTRQELEDDWKRKNIPEALDRYGNENNDPNESNEANENEDEKEDDGPSTAGLAGDRRMSAAMESHLNNAEQEVAALRTALSECWTLCNTLSNLSSSHRQRTFKLAGKQEVQEQAWRSCWRLCQQLYDSRDEDHASQVIPTLELCRDFCQSLFEARQKADEASDSVLRVSFELNNHLYNTHDRALPEAFNERTLDFYITICHRLMKQRTSLPQETDSLLRACWSLAEMLFNLRQSNREGKSPDEELLGSSVQACWDLCDLFRDGWTQIRPDRGTPRPSQTTFPRQLSFKSSSSRSDAQSSSNISSRHFHDAVQARSLPPETPSTVFDDATTATSSPDSAPVPNILVLGPASTASTGSGSVRGGGTHHDRWSSNASVLSGYSESASSNRTSSTATAQTEEAHLARLRYLLLKAGANTGYSRTSGQHLPAYVNTLPEAAFGTLPWQKKVFSYYKALVLGDKSLLTAHTMPSRRLGANEVAKSVKWLGNGEKWAWMRDLYRLVFGFGIDEADRKGGSFQT